MTEVKVTEAFRYEGKKYEPGQVVDLPDAVARSVVKKDHGKYPDDGDEEAPTIEPSGAPEDEREGPESAPSPLRETENGIDVSGYRSADYLSADDVEEGDEMVIEGSGWKDDRFDREALYLPVSIDGEKYQWRVNKTNAQILADAFGTNTGDWVGETSVVDEIKEYPGVPKGIVVRASS